MGKGSEAEALLGDAAGRSLRYYFPSRIEEELLLRWVLDRNGNDINAAYGLGNLLYDKRRHDEAIGVWQAALSVKEDAAVLRNLAIAMWNTRWDGDAAFTMYEKAVTLDPEDGRMAYEFDQLRKKINHSPADRLQWMESRRNLIAERDDASVELAALYNLNGKAEIAYELLSQRTFHPWEGGEGKVLQQWRVCCIQLGRQALENGDPTGATQWFSKVLETPDNLGEKYHLLQARADIYYWLGMAAKGAGDKQLAQERFQRSAGESGDFRDMAVTAHSEMTWYRAESLRELGREEEALALFNELLQHANRLAEKEANIEYFATSLPRLLVFEEDIQKMQQAESHLLVAYARRGKGQDEAAAKALDAARQINRSDMRLQEFS
jgi:tetratricopeptide (TPR) repeat protein